MGESVPLAKIDHKNLEQIFYSSEVLGDDFLQVNLELRKDLLEAIEKKKLTDFKNEYGIKTVWRPTPESLVSKSIDALDMDFQNILSKGGSMVTKRGVYGTDDMENTLYLAWPKLRHPKWRDRNIQEIPSPVVVYDRFSKLFIYHIMDINGVDKSYVKKALGGRNFWEPSMSK